MEKSKEARNVYRAKELLYVVEEEVEKMKRRQEVSLLTLIQ